jgi:hypothetical protein
MPASSKSSAGKADPAVVEKHDSAQTEPAMSEAERREVMIRIAAYSFYERRGFVAGHELEDWLQAEWKSNANWPLRPSPRQRSNRRAIWVAGSAILRGMPVRCAHRSTPEQSPS